MSNWDTGIVEEFRANGGQVGGGFKGAPLLLLHHVGAKTGTERVSPLMYQQLDEAYAIFASKGGAPHNPAWFHNLSANPNTKIEVGAGMVAVQARIADGEEYARIWERQKSEWPQFADYERKTSRKRIPVVVLEATAL
jgi:deazaflavin-dependent oxidoreductase (nitroreductase family)